jgi:hypothetical protein
LLAIGIPGNLVSVVIYFVSLSGVTIFGVPPQNGGFFALLIKTLEVVYVVDCVYVMKAKPRSSKEEYTGLTEGNIRRLLR